MWRIFLWKGICNMTKQWNPAFVDGLVMGQVIMPFVGPVSGPLRPINLFRGACFTSALVFCCIDSFDPLRLSFALAISSYIFLVWSWKCAIALSFETEYLQNPTMDSLLTRTATAQNRYKSLNLAQYDSFFRWKANPSFVTDTPLISFGHVQAPSKLWSSPLWLRLIFMKPWSECCPVRWEQLFRVIWRDRYTRYMKQIRLELKCDRTW